MVVQCNSGAAIPYIGVIQDRICIILDYDGNSTAQYMYKHAVIYTHYIVKQPVSNTVHYTA